MSKHKARQQARIVSAAMEVIQKEGLSRVNMSKLAEAAGMTRQTLYNHFPDVESIIITTLDMHGEAMLTHLKAAMAGANSARAKLEAYGAFQIEAASPEHALIPLEAGLSAKARSHIAEHEEAVFALLRHTIEAGLQTGEFTADTAPPILAGLVHGLVQGGVASALRHPAQKPEVLTALGTALRTLL